MKLSYLFKFSKLVLTFVIFLMLTWLNVHELGVGCLDFLYYWFIAYEWWCFSISFLYFSIDAVSDRDFVLEFLSINSITAIHLSRLGEDWVLWASEEFGFLIPNDSVSTGSSIMPQKKNPDPMELVRGKCGRVVGDLVTLLTVCKGLPLAYNRDLQVWYFHQYELFVLS